MPLVHWDSASAAHIHTRSQRYGPGALDIEPEWTEEAANDVNGLWYDPDPNSAIPDSLRIIGYSAGAGRVLTVLAFREADVIHGATAFVTTGKDLRVYRERSRQ